MLSLGESQGVFNFPVWLKMSACPNLFDFIYQHTAVSHESGVLALLRGGTAGHERVGQQLSGCSQPPPTLYPLPPLSSERPSIGD